MKKLLWQTQSRVELTKQMIEDAEPNSIILVSDGYIEHPWFNNAVVSLEDDGRSTAVIYVVYRGTIPDWCIYHSMDANFISEDYLDSQEHLGITPERIARAGAKPHREEIIRSLVKCTDEVFNMYRH